MRRFLQRFAALDAEAWAAAGARFLAAEGTAAFRTADRALGIAVERSGRAAERDAVLGPLRQVVGRIGEEDDVEAVTAAALAAVLALVVADVLDEGAFDVLYEPVAALVPLETLGGG